MQMTRQKNPTDRQIVLMNQIDELCDEIQPLMDRHCKLLNEYNQLTLDLYFLNEERNKLTRELYGM